MNNVTVITLDKRQIKSDTNPEVETITARMTKSMLDEALFCMFDTNICGKAYFEMLDAYYELTGMHWNAK